MAKRTIAQIVSRIKAGDYSDLEEMSAEEQEAVRSILSEMQEGSTLLIDSLWAVDYERKPATFDKFIEDDYYLGQVGVGLFDFWKEKLPKVHDPKNEVNELIIRGSIGIGKTTVGVLSLLYRMHALLCLKDPQSYYGLMKGSPIVFGLFNIYKYLAESTAYKYLLNWVKMSPFFRDAMRNALEKEGKIPEWMQELNRVYGLKNEALSRSLVRFPKGITLALGSQAIGVLGQNLFGGLLDEADMGKNKAITNAEKGQIAELYGQAKSRMDSRFAQKGGTNPGLLVLVSQVRDVDSFLEIHTAKVMNNVRTMSIGASIWEVKRDVYPDDEPRFRVVVGTQNYRSFIVDDNAKIPETAKIIKVPVSLRERFEYDLDDAIRDLAGVPTFGANLFLTRRDKLFDCFENGTLRQHPFSVETVELSIESDDTMEISDVFKKEFCMRQHNKSTGAWAPRWFAGVSRAVHVDLALKHDYAGISMGCIGDVKQVKRFDEDGRPYYDLDYCIFIDFALRVRAKRGSEIDFSKIRKFIFYLSDIGFPIKWVSADGFQSSDTLQTMTKAGFDCKVLSVDRKANPYNYLKSAIYENRFDMYEYGPFVDEITHLEDHSMTKRKPPIDHPLHGSKDISDGVCGVVTRIAEEKGLLKVTPTDKQIDQQLASHQKRSNPSDLLKSGKWVANRVEDKSPMKGLFD